MTTTGPFGVDSFGEVLMGRVLALAALAAFAQDDSFKSFKGKQPPEITIPDTGWINSKPLKLEALKGRVVWLEFSFIK